MEESCLRKNIFQGELQITDFLPLTQEKFLTRVFPIVICTSVIYRASEDISD